ncbi:MAG TPA: cytochrome c [Vicinamibacteria bacterium]|nr:cytochrome c [Vicinamibacteria bacterium]
MTARLPAAALVLLAAAGCHRQAAAPPGEPMLDALRAEEQAAGLTYAEGQGKHLFDRYCATCHGDLGKGDGQNASNLSPPVPDLTSSKSLGDAAYVRRVIAEGSAAVGRSPLSPPWGRTLSAQEIDYVARYCRALAAKKP